jgi:hypothetical protein
MKTTLPQPEQSGISRRKLIQGAAALTLAATTRTLATTTAGSPPFCYGNQDEATHTQPLDDINIYPLLAVWLLLTTNSEWHKPGQELDLAKIASSLNLQQKCVKDLFAMAGKTENVEAFAAVRHQFNVYAKDQALYTGAGCPQLPSTITKISNLYSPSAAKKPGRKNR